MCMRKGIGWPGQTKELSLETKKKKKKKKKFSIGYWIVFKKHFTTSYKILRRNNNAIKLLGTGHIKNNRNQHDPEGNYCY